MKPTTEQWADIEESVGRMFTPVNLLCDGYLISTDVQRDKMKLVVAVYVNGHIRGKDMWFGMESEIEGMGDIARKFHHWIKRKRKAKDLKSLEVIYGKRECKKRGFYEAHIATVPYFPSAKAFVSHIKKHCESVEEISREEYGKRIAELKVEN